MVNLAIAGPLINDNYFPECFENIAPGYIDIKRKRKAKNAEEDAFLETSLVTYCSGNHFPKQVAQSTSICLSYAIIWTRDWTTMDTAFVLHSNNVSYMVVFS